MSAIIPVSRFKLVDPHGKLGKISNNLETHGEEFVTGFTYPFEVMLTEEALDMLMGKYFWRSLFNTDAQTGLPTPIHGFMRCKPLEVQDTYEGVKATIEKDKRSESFEKCRVSKLVLEPKVGGLTLCSGHLYLRPGTDEINVWLQHLQQKTDVSIEMLDGAIEKKASSRQQQSLPLPTPEGDKAAASSSGSQPPPALDDTGPGKALNVALDEAGVEPQSGAEVQPEAAEATNGSSSDPIADLAEFEKGAKKQAAAFTTLATTGVIDGRSERVKQQDRAKAAKH